MKKLLVFSIMMFFIGVYYNKVVFTENISYPFDNITIVEAKKFDITIPNNITPESLLFGIVEADEIITVYIARIVMKEVGSIQTSESTVLILSDADENDLIRYIINNFYQQIDIRMGYGFAAHILIDATMGVYKDMTLINEMKEIGILHDLVSNHLKLIDNTGLEIPMIEGSYELKTNLNILISVNTGGQS